MTTAASVPDPSAAAASEDGGAPTAVRITVRAIKVSNDDAGMDSKLGAIAQHIQAYADQSKFKSFKLVEEHGFDLDWSGFDRDYRPGRVALPTYPFERQRYPVPDREGLPPLARYARAVAEALPLLVSGDVPRFTRKVSLILKPAPPKPPRPAEEAQD